MARPDRGVAQRYAAKKRRKRLLTERPTGAPAARTVTMAEPPVAERVLPEVPSSSSGPRVVLTSPSAGRAGRARATPHRPFTAYTEEYRYIGADLRRVAAVAGGLLVAVILLSFILR